jgi:cytochrome b
VSILEKNPIVWDKWIRLSHLIVAVVILLNLYVLEEGDPPHRYLGYFAVGVIALRFFYGFLSKNQPHSLTQFPLSFSSVKKFILFKSH